MAGLLLAFAIVVVAAAVDLSTDEAEGMTLWHVVIEGLVISAGLAGGALVLRKLVAARRRVVETEAERDALAERLVRTRQEAERYRAETRELLEGLGVAIDRQLDAWSLTGAEKEVALLMLKGLSHKEIGAAREVSDATVRQQARAVYKKAGVAGRSELAAFFLEDLMLPVSQR